MSPVGNLAQVTALTESVDAALSDQKLNMSAISAGRAPALSTAFLEGAEWVYSRLGIHMHAMYSMCLTPQIGCSIGSGRDVASILGRSHGPFMLSG